MGDFKKRDMNLCDNDTQTTHEKFMKRCLTLAQLAKNEGKTAVGAVVVHNKKIIAEGREGEEGLPAALAHAEMLAVLKAQKTLTKKELAQCSLYTTVEPCFMCSYLIRSSGIKQLVYGITTPETGGDSSQFPFLATNHIKKWGKAPKIVTGVLAEACSRMLS